MKNNKRTIAYIITAIVIIAGCILGYRYYRFAQAHENTDNAQVDGNVVPVIARVSSYVNKIYAEDNQQVKQGDVLVELDPADLQLKLNQAQAALESARATLSVATANAADAQSNRGIAHTSIEGPKTNLWKAQNDYKRYNELYAQKLATPQQLDDYKARLENAQAQYDLAKEKYEATGLQTQSVQNQVKVAEANVHLREKDVDYARLQLAYTRIIAPVSGVVSKKSIQPGQLVQAAQPLMALVQSNDIWVTANFKETQLDGMRTGNAVKITVDAYPDMEVDGTVESIGGATGAKFSLLPPDNATGNFVKVVQRIPVRIKVSHNAEVDQLLKPGLSVYVVVSKS